jgi:hypothetical protein
MRGFEGQKRVNSIFQDSDRILSIDRFKKSLRDVKSALGNLVAMASRAVLVSID